MNKNNKTIPENIINNEVEYEGNVSLYLNVEI